jgi:hypothetical protein
MKGGVIISPITRRRSQLSRVFEIAGSVLLSSLEAHRMGEIVMSSEGEVVAKD